MDAQTSIRVGIVGCGYQGKNLALAVEKTPSLRLVACADPDRDAASQLAVLASGVSTYASIDALLQDTPVDAIMVATSHDALYECSLAALRAHKHVLAEKPIGIDEEQGAQLEKAATEAGVSFMSGYSFRYFPALQKAKDLLREEAIGKIISITGIFAVGPMDSGWKAVPEKGGGPLLYVGCHLIDQMLWYLGDEPSAVTADVRYRADTRAEETAAFQIAFAGGTLAQGMVTQAAARSFVNTVDIVGDLGVLSIRGQSGAYTLIAESANLPAYAEPTTLTFPRMMDGRMVMHTPQMAEFVAAIREQRQPTENVADARRVLAIIDAIHQSARLGRTVRFG